MIDLRPKEGDIPARPPGLHKTTKDIVRLFGEGSTVAYGGLSLIGAEGYVVRVIGIMRIENKALKGWCLAIGHPGTVAEFRYVDGDIRPLGALEMPNTMMYFFCEADQELGLPVVPQEKLVEVARFVAPFISDEGPPVGVDW